MAITTRWWSNTTSFGDIKPSHSKNQYLGPALRPIKLLSIVNTVAKLKMDMLLLLIFVKASYNLEGDSPLV